MDRRTAVALLGTVVLGGCGGGGGSAGNAENTGAAPGGTDSVASVQATTPPPGASRNIAFWGDSLTPPVAANLQMLYPDREVYDGGVDGETSAQIAARQLADTAHRAWLNVFWYGQNNPSDPARIKADIAASVAALAPGNHRFLVLAVVNQDKPAELRGGVVYEGLIRLNGELAALYPQNYLDMRAVLVAAYDPTSAQDREDFQNDVLPTSLRIDEIHLRNEGSLLVATKVKEFIDGKGW